MDWDQEQAFGGLDPQTAKHLTSLARGNSSRADRPRRLKPGTVLAREHQGEATYLSLSTIARAITGTNWNGPRFFGLRIEKESTISPENAEPL